MDGNRLTTIQVNRELFDLLKRRKEDMRAESYAEVISRALLPKTKRKSMAGSLKRYFKEQSIKDIVKELQDERRKSDRF